MDEWVGPAPVTWIDVVCFFVFLSVNVLIGLSLFFVLIRFLFCFSKIVLFMVFLFDLSLMLTCP